MASSRYKIERMPDGIARICTCCTKLLHAPVRFTSFISKLEICINVCGSYRFHLKFLNNRS